MSVSVLTVFVWKEAKNYVPDTIFFGTVDSSSLTSVPVTTWNINDFAHRINVMFQHISFINITSLMDCRMDEGFSFGSRNFPDVAAAPISSAFCSRVWN